MRAAAAAWLFLVVACSARSSEPPLPPPGTVVIAEDSIVLRQGAIGVRDKENATYVLVDVENRSPEDRLVGVQGVLEDAAGAEVGKLVVDELRIPPGTKRTFALVAGKVVPEARRARLEVRRAVVPKDPPPIVVTDVVPEAEGETLAVTARVRNTLHQAAVVTLLASFHDENGKILSRPFVILDLDADASRPFRFEGPKGAKKAEVYVGESVF